MEKDFQVVALIFIRSGRLLGFSSSFHRLTLRIKLLPRPIPVLSYGFNC